MSLLNVNINTNLVEQYPEYITYDSKLKDKYGEVNTPYKFIGEMISTIPVEYGYNKDMKWLDAGAGHGNFSFCLFLILLKSLENVIPDPTLRKQHIIQNMIYMVEVNEDSVSHLREKFGPDANIFHQDYLSWNTDLKFDFIIGNPPYNCDGVKKVPTKTNTNKKDDGKTIWPDFMKKNISLLKEGGMMNVVVPCLWMKPDKAGMYDLLLKYQIEKLHAYHSSAVMKTFNYQVQTPLCYFLLTKRENQGKIQLYDQQKKTYIDFSLQKHMPIPLCFSSIVNKFLKMVHQYGALKVIKTNMPPNNAKISANPCLGLESDYPFKNIKTTVLNKDKTPSIQVNYSDTPLAHHGERKIVMAHKMYGFPYLDKEGTYGISSRDNYIINNRSNNELYLLNEFLSTTLILFLFDTTRYRMRYLEKYVFEYIPDFSKIPEAVNMFDTGNIDIYKLMGLDEQEKQYIEGYHKTKYKRCIGPII
jgi:hypothetical protein